MNNAQMNEYYSAANDDTRTTQLTLTLHSSADNSRHRFEVPASLRVAEFVELALERLAERLGNEQVEAMRRYYDPVLELTDEARELSPELPLAEAGVTNEADCRIAAKPRKERMICCAGG